VASSLTYRIAALETSLSTGAWTTWTPVWTQTATPTFTNTRSRYARTGRIIVAHTNVTFTSAGTAAATITCTLPVTAVSAVGMVIGTFRGLDNGTTFYQGSVELASTTTVVFIVDQAGGYVGGGPAWTIANTDTMSFTITYESAS